jgi:hypothetical protein
MSTLSVQNIEGLSTLNVANPFEISSLNVDTITTTGNVIVGGGISSNGSYGTAGQVLTSGGSGVAASWETLSSSATLITSFSMNFGATTGSVSGLDLTGYTFLNISMTGITGLGSYWYINSSGSTSTGIRWYRGANHGVIINAIQGTTADSGHAMELSDADKITNSTTTIYFASSSGNFTGGTCYIYGFL